MKDLDFDELDRAVSSLMSDKNSPAPGTPSTPSQADTLSEVDSLSASVPPSPSQSSVVETPSPRPSRPAPPAARRPGRFMDVVAVRKDAAVSRPVSRQGVAVQPVASPPAPEPVAPIEATAPPEVSATPSSSSADWPDPLELASAESTKQSTLGEPDFPSVMAEPREPASSPEEKGLVDEPLSSPFLPDAKVEKRPLGSAALTSTETALMVEDENAQLPALPKDVEPALPEELHGDVVSIEADDSTTNPAQHLKSPSESSTPESKKDETLPREVKPVVTVTEAAMPSGPTSIAQQYKEEPTTGDTKNGAIYDTDSYHQPISHPAKKKSGWGWVLWIILILVVGAGGGAALYLLGIF